MPRQAVRVDPITGRPRDSWTYLDLAVVAGVLLTFVLLGRLFFPLALLLVVGLAALVWLVPTVVDWLDKSLNLGWIPGFAGDYRVMAVAGGAYLLAASIAGAVILASVGAAQPIPAVSSVATPTRPPGVVTPTAVSQQIVAQITTLSSLTPTPLPTLESPPPPAPQPEPPRAQTHADSAPAAPTAPRQSPPVAVAPTVAAVEPPASKPTAAAVASPGASPVADSAGRPGASSARPTATPRQGGQTQAQQGPTAQAIPDKPTGSDVLLEVASLTTVVNPGGRATLRARTSPGASCDGTVEIPGAGSQGLGAQVAGDDGICAWVIPISANATSGDAHISISATTGGKSRTVTASLHIG